MAQVQFINVPGVGRAKLGDYVHRRLRGAIRPATSQSAELSFFKHTAGDAIQGDSTSSLTRYDTNLKQKDGLPPGWAAMVYYSSLELQMTMTLAEIQDLQRKTLFELIIGSVDKVLDDGHAISYATGAGIAGTSVQNAAEQWSLGVPAAGARSVYAVPHFIPSKPRLPFEIKASWPGSASGGATAALAQTSRYTWWWNLEGIVRLPVG